jgi:hypothetical protein
VRYALLVMLLVSGCYEAPDYSGTHFKCDADHACPEGQACINGICGGMGSGSNIDAPPSAAGVLCGTTTCAANQKCCSDFIGGPACIAMNATCAGIAATCDGVEDCSGMPCCDVGGATVACASSCQTQVCRDNTDCSASAPNCCPSIGTNEPWGRCSPVCP